MVPITRQSCELKSNLQAGLLKLLEFILNCHLYKHINNNVFTSAIVYILDANCYIFIQLLLLEITTNN